MQCCFCSSGSLLCKGTFSRAQQEGSVRLSERRTVRIVMVPLLQVHRLPSPTISHAQLISFVLAMVLVFALLVAAVPASTTTS